MFIGVRDLRDRRVDVIGLDELYPVRQLLIGLSCRLS